MRQNHQAIYILLHILRHVASPRTVRRYQLIGAYVLVVGGLGHFLHPFFSLVSAGEKGTG